MKVLCYTNDVSFYSLWRIPMKTVKQSVCKHILPAFLAAVTALSPLPMTAFAADSQNAATFAEAPAAFPELLPDMTTGEYTFTYSEAKAGKTYVVYVLAGLYTETEAPTITDSNVLYYNTAKADADGMFTLSFVPSMYTDSTLFLAGDGMDTPKRMCYVKADGALDVADFELTLDKNNFVVHGDGRSYNTHFHIQAIDSFGFATELPSYTKYEIFEDSGSAYTGDRIRIVKSTDTMIIDSMAEAGNYTLSITCGNLVRTVDFTVSRDASVVKNMYLKIDDADQSSFYYFDAKTGVDKTVFSPESYTIAAFSEDQYGDLIPDTYTYTYTIYGMNGEADVDTVIDTTDPVYVFTPKDVPPIGEARQYAITVQSNANKGYSQKVDFIVEGSGIYTGAAEKLFTLYREARTLIARIETGDIVITDDAELVPSSKKWTTAEIAERLKSEAALTAELLKLHEQTAQTNKELNSRFEKLQNIIQEFNRSLMNGKYAPIEEMYFPSEFVEMPLNQVGTIDVVTKPSRPSELPTYESADPTIATVDNEGKVTTLAEGTVRITAYNADKTMSAYYDLNIYAPIDTLEFDKRNVTLVTGEFYSPTIHIQPEVHNDAVTLSSSNQDVVRITDGKIYAVDGGEAIVSATTKSGTSAQIGVRVIKPSFLATEYVRAVHGAKVSLKLSATDMFNFVSLDTKVTYDPAVFTFEEATVAGNIAQSYVSTEKTAEGEVVSTWNFEEVLDKTSAEDFITYVFSVNADAVYADHKIVFAMLPKTAGGDIATADSFAPEATIRVGETDTYNVRLTTNGNGSVSGDGDYAYGTEVTVKATPNNKYLFSGWYQGTSLISENSKYTFTLTEDTVLQAKFEKKPISVVDRPSRPSTSTGGPSTSTTLTSKVKTVTSNVAPGEVKKGTKVELSCATPGATIYYTTDGTIPNANSLVYTQPILIVQTVNIRVIAIRNGYTNSDRTSFAYRVIEEKPAEQPEQTTEQTPSISANVKIALKPEAGAIKYVANTPYIRPNDPATRYEVVEMLYKLFDVTGVTETKTFPDLAPDYKHIVDLYAGAGIINGYEDGTFGGMREITRAELVKILSIMLGLDKDIVQGEETVTMTDIEGHWAISHIRKFVAKGYIVGYPEGDFRPDKAVSRAEAITILNRVIGKVKTPGLAPRFADVPADFWGFDEIMNAVEG